jgi:ASC-1-like (ASCH) protein
MEENNNVNGNWNVDHELKILPEYFEAVRSGEKRFELRKNDRNFKVGDWVGLREFNGGEIYRKNICRKNLLYFKKLCRIWA